VANDDGQRADRPEVDALRDKHRQAREELDGVIVVTEAENTIASARQTELVTTQQAAWRRWVAAKGLLTKARKDGSADKIAAARRRVDAASAEFDRTADAVVAEMQQHNRARLERLGQVLDRRSPAWEADCAVTDALARLRPPRSQQPLSPGEGGQ